ncbi:DotG/IcmE/VirB10 family protein [Paraburkholderia sp. BR10872]|uniref:DotG/IcmE/VirB10 family protein n=1 Tax=Paraburkholderia sp. BR10872 TaxID=3236989 RepID=UPI0034D27FE2
MAENNRKMHPGFMRNLKVIGAIVAVAAVGGVLVFMSAKNKPADTAPTNLPPTMNAKGGKPSPETKRYSDSLNQANQEGLAQAERSGGTFVPALSDRNAEINAALDARGSQQTQPAQPQKIDYQTQPGQAAAQQLPPLPQPAAGVGQEVSSLATQWTTYPTQEVLGIQKEASTTPATGATAAAATPGSSSTAPKVVLIHANDKYYGHLENAIKTDAPSDSLITMDQGPCKGGELRGAGKLTGEEVTASYTVLTCNGQTYSVQAEALNADTLSNALPADLDHHVISHIAVPALLGAIGAAGQVFANAGATMTTSPLGGTTVVQSTSPSGRQLAGAAASGGTNGVTSVIQKVNDAVPQITGTVNANTPVVVLFKADVAAQ